VESIGFKKLKITNSDMNGIWACSGPTIDAPSYNFIAIIDK
jgi:hypothetical protein